MIKKAIIPPLPRLMAAGGVLIWLAAGCVTPDVPRIEDYLTPEPGLPESGEAGIDRDRPPEEATEAAGVLTLEKCLAIALDRNPRLRAAREGIAVAREEVGLARAPYYPELSLAGSYSRWQSRAFLPEGIGGPNPPTIIGPTDDWSGGLRAGWNLFDSGSRAAALRSALAREGLAGFEAERVRQELVLETRRSYYAAVAAREAVEASRQNLLRAEENLRISREREEVGAVAPADVLRTRVEVADARLALVKAESLVRLARGGLNTVMGLPVETEAALAPPAEEIFPGEEVEPAEAIRRALETRPEIQAALHRIGAARGSVDAAQSAFGPRVRADARYGRRDVDFFPEDEDWAVGLALELPLFEGFFRGHNLSREKHNLSREEEEVRHLILQVKDQVWAACQGLVEARESLPAAEVLVTEAQESMRRTRERYRVGAATTTDLLAAQTTLARAELIAVESRRGYRDARAAFDRAVGAISW